jgi:DNA-binding CsgD family transcriptional regulator
MRKSLEVDIRIKEISRIANIKTKQKIKEILNLKPDITNKDISDILGVTIRTIERHRK